MRAVAVLGVLGFVAMAGALVYGFTVGDFWSEGRVLTAMPWGVVSLIDVYVGFALFLGWVAYREASVARTAVWVLLVLTLGNVITSGYVLLALARSHGDWRHFWMGARAA
jgi:hypothetical protein